MTADKPPVHDDMKAALASGIAWFVYGEYTDVMGKTFTIEPPVIPEKEEK